MNRNESAGDSCTICGVGALQETSGYRAMRRVTSDCRPWPAGGRIAICESCGGVQKPADSQFLSDIGAIYRSYAIYSQGNGAEQAVFNHGYGSQTSRSSQLLDRFTRHITLGPVGRMLDIGCGNGAMLRAFGTRFPEWIKAGTEFDARHQRVIESIPNTVPLHVGSPVAVPGVFDVVTLIHVLEHVIDPVGELQNIRKKITPNGVLLIEVPAHQSNPFELLIADHRTHFSIPSLERVLTRAGFEIDIISDCWVSRELSVVARPFPPVSSAAQHGLTRQSSSISASLEWLQRIAGQLRDLGRETSVGLFGTSIAGTWLAEEALHSVEFFVDEDVNRVGRMHLNRPIVAPAEVPEGRRVFIGLPTTAAVAVAERLTRQGLHCITPA